ncbi:amino acid ABC transporter permease [Burkholderia pseudomultivorans]|uniref:amino acid ABC transporter permease n=1 Tax=Burkholderia pseudomultivorans TaxID=1207504 RepID=UPI00075F5C71|nr:amino acid ABC transporter permease [Burkholderia pseudomultivorans]KWF06447.1 amino acid ABC transporter permease [Burkholderia pseudomultivorans]
MIDILSQYGLLVLVGQYPDGPLGGVSLTLVMSLIALVAAFPVAVAVAVARTSPIRAIRRASSIYVTLVRGIPLLLIIFWAYFVLPLVIGIATSATVTVICALVIYEGAYLGEAIRAALQALPKGQAEAARSLGMSYGATLFKVILPQALFNCLPSMMNQFVLIVKNTSLAYIIGAHELTFSANSINAQLLTQPFQVYITLAALYFILCYSLSRLSSLVERRVLRKRSGNRGRQTDSRSSFAKVSP